MKANIHIEDPEVKERENAFWMAVLSYVEPVFLWFVYPVRLVVYPILWGLLVYHFSKGTLFPGWLDWLAILIVVGGRFWFLFSEK